jgi:DNA-binding NarL/FixJ family response regulator
MVRAIAFDHTADSRRMIGSATFQSPAIRLRARSPRPRPRSVRTGSAVGSLTEREMQIARLIVDRKTDAEIARELFLSKKTIETHICNMFPRLDASSRVDIARAVEKTERVVR